LDGRGRSGASTRATSRAFFGGIRRTIGVQTKGDLMAKRVTFMRVPTHSRLQGVYKATDQYIVEGQAATPNEGGGFIGRMELAGGLIYVRKVTADGKPHRDFGTVAVQGDKRTKLLADGVAISAEGFVVLFNDEKDEQRGK
jgi:hypothetical protein